MASGRLDSLEVADGDLDLCGVEEMGGFVGDENLDRADAAAGRDKVDVVGRSPRKNTIPSSTKSTSNASEKTAPGKINIQRLICDLFRLFLFSSVNCRSVAPSLANYCNWTKCSNYTIEDPILVKCRLLSQLL